MALTVIDARDALLRADEFRFLKEHQCIISKAFASRGLGIGARSDSFEDDFTPLPDCL